MEIEKRYKLNHTEEELNYRKQLQQKFLFFHKQRDRTSFNGMRKTWKWLRTHYFNNKVKDSIETYEYSKHIRNNFLKLMFDAFIKSSVFMVAIFFWMRLVKHKGKKDIYYLIFMNGFLGISLFSANCYYLLMKTRLPLTRTNLDYRKELIEDFVFGCNKSIVLTEEIKKISKFYLPERIEHSFVTSLGQKVTFIVFKGRLYLSCDNYAEVFGYSGKNKLAKMDLLNVMLVREREIIYGLFKLYDNLVDKYMDKHKVEMKPVNFDTKILEQVAKEMNLTDKQIDMLIKSKQFREIQFDKLKNENIEEVESQELLNTVDKNENIILENKINDKKENAQTPINSNTSKPEEIKKRFYM